MWVRGFYLNKLNLNKVQRHGFRHEKNNITIFIHFTDKACFSYLFWFRWIVLLYNYKLFLRKPSISDYGKPFVCLKTGDESMDRRKRIWRKDRKWHKGAKIHRNMIVKGRCIDKSLPVHVKTVLKRWRNLHLKFWCVVAGWRANTESVLIQDFWTCMFLNISQKDMKICTTQS